MNCLNIAIFCFLINYVSSSNLVAPKCDYLISGQIAAVAFKDKTNNDLDPKIECYIAVCKVNSERECIVDRSCKRCLKYHTSYNKDLCDYAKHLYDSGFLINFYGRIDSNQMASNDVCLLESSTIPVEFWN